MFRKVVKDLAINSKAKGSEYERKIAKKLTQWSGYEFNRTPMSGGLHWEEDNNVSGDIVPPAELKFPFSIECKKREIDWEFDTLLRETSQIWDFYKQSCRDSSRYISKGIKKEPMVVFSKNRRESYMLIHKEIFEFFFSNSEVKHVEVIIDENCKVVLMSFDEFLSLCTLEDVLTLKDFL